MTFVWPGPDRTWLSFIEEPPDDFPAFFTTEDMEAMNLEPDYDGAERVKRQIKNFDTRHPELVTMSDRDYFRRLLNLTDDEKFSLSLAESEHTYNVRLIYFAGKRCKDCTDRKSCIRHEDMMLVADEEHIWAMYSDR